MAVAARETHESVWSKIILKLSWRRAETGALLTPHPPHVGRFPGNPNLGVHLRVSFPWRGNPNLGFHLRVVVSVRELLDPTYRLIGL